MARVGTSLHLIVVKIDLTLIDSGKTSNGYELTLVGVDMERVDMSTR